MKHIENRDVLGRCQLLAIIRVSVQGYFIQKNSHVSIIPNIENNLP